MHTFKLSLNAANRIDCSHPVATISTYRTDHRINIDILFLVDRLEELFNKGRRFPLTHRVVLQEQAFLDIIDQMRVSIPEEIRQARRVNDEKDRILDQAHEEAERTVTTAQEQAAFLLEEKGLTRQAQTQADAILAGARERADKHMAEADAYCIGVLTGLEEELARLLTTAHNGVERLRAGQTEPKGEPGGP